MTNIRFSNSEAVYQLSKFQSYFVKNKDYVKRFDPDLVRNLKRAIFNNQLLQLQAQYSNTQNLIVRKLLEASIISNLQFHSIEKSHLKSVLPQTHNDKPLSHKSEE